jgi:hypothetical protein
MMFFFLAEIFSIALSNARTTRNVKRREKGKGKRDFNNAFKYLLFSWMVSISSPVLCGLFHNVWF